MSPSQASLPGPRAVKPVSEILERAVRAAACESALGLRDEAQFAADLCARATFAFDRGVGDAAVTGCVEHARLDLIVSARRFAESPVRRRLATLPSMRLHLATDTELDLLAIGEDGSCFAIRLATAWTAVERKALAARVRALSPNVAELLIYGIDDGKLRRQRLVVRSPSASR